LIYVTSVPHPKSPATQRTTFVCYPCNRTWSYTLAPPWPRLMPPARRLPLLT